MVVDVHDPEAARFRARHLQAADRDVRALLDMLPQHELVIHLVDVVSREQHDESCSVRLDDVDVLIDGVGRAKIPVCLRDALARRQDIEAFIALGTKEVPAHLEMSDQAVSLVLGRNRDAADSRVNRIG